MPHCGDEEPDEEDVEVDANLTTDDNLSTTSFVSRQDTYVSRANIMEKIYDK